VIVLHENSENYKKTEEKSPVEYYCQLVLFTLQIAGFCVRILVCGWLQVGLGAGVPTTLAFRMSSASKLGNFNFAAKQVTVHLRLDIFSSQFAGGRQVGRVISPFV